MYEISFKFVAFTLDDKLYVIMDCQDLSANVVLFNLDITVISSDFVIFLSSSLSLVMVLASGIFLPPLGLNEICLHQKIK